MNQPSILSPGGYPPGGEGGGVSERRIPMDNQFRTLRDFFDIDSADIFEKASQLNRFMDELRGHEFFHWRRSLSGPSQGRVELVDPYTGQTRTMVMMASNNYLGLTTHPRVVEAGLEAVRQYGAGAGSVPLLGGSNELHRRLEERLARFKGCEDAIVFTSGYGSNVGCVSALLRPKDVAINDRLNHASLIDGCRLAGCELVTFRHNDMESLEHTLQRCNEKYRGKLVIADGVFSMDGDITRLPELVELSHRYGARVMIDEAHSSGVIGRNGRGTPEHYDMEGKVDIVAGTLSKALGGVGGFVASRADVIEYIRFYARSYMFSTALPPQVCGSLMAAIDVIEEEQQLREQLWQNIRYFQSALRQMGFDIGNAETAIVPIIIGKDSVLFEMSRDIHRAGIFLNSVFYPAVPKRLARLRMSLMATHTREDLDQTLNVLEDVGRKYGIIK